MLSIQLLGNFHLRYKDEWVTAISQPRQQSLLAYLLLRCRTPQPRRQIAFTLWPDTSEQQAFTNLRRELYHLRQDLPEADRFLYVENQILGWRAAAPYRLDVAIFEDHLVRAEEATRQDQPDAEHQHMAQAVAGYTGPLLPDAYDEWIVEDRERLAQHYVRALERLIEHLTESGDYAAGIRYVEQLLRHDRFREATYRQLMQLHLHNGDRAQTLHAYHACATMLEQELGVEPAAATRGLYEQLLDLEETQAFSPKQQKEVLAEPRRVTQPTFVGRQSEWQALQQAWQTARAGRAGFVCITGEPGIGKSRLTEEVLAWVGQQGIATAYTRSYAAEGRLAYDPIAEWLRSDPLQRRVRHLDDLWRIELVRLRPELLAEHPDLPYPEPMVEGWQRRRFFEALARAFLSSPEPLLLVLDDLQWCDRETLEWLHYLFRFDGKARLLVIGTARPGEVEQDHPLVSLLHQLRQTRQVMEIELRHLADEETVQLAQQVISRPLSSREAADICQMTEGNPLFVEEMLRAEGDQGWGRASWSDGMSVGHNRSSAQPLSPKLQSVIEARLDRLSTDARHLAELAATVGRSFTYAILREASHSAEDQLVMALDELWQQRIVHEQEADHYDFSHDKIREVAYAAIGPVRRRLLHRQVAEAMEHLHSEDLESVSAQIANHYKKAGERLRAARFYHRAAETARAVLAYEEIISYLQQGIAQIQLIPSSDETVALEIDMQLRLGETLSATKGLTTPAAGRAFERARQLCLQSGDERQLISAHEHLRSFHGNCGNWLYTRSLIENQIERAKEADNQNMLKYAFSGLGWALYAMGELTASHQYIERAIALGKPRYPDLETFSTDPNHGGGLFHMLVLWMLGYPDIAWEIMQGRLTFARMADNRYRLAVAGELVAVFHHYCRDYEQMAARADELLTVANQYGYALYQRIGLLLKQRAAVEVGATRGYPHPPLDLLRQQIDTMLAEGLRLFIPYYLSLLAEIYAHCNLYDAGIAALDEALSMTAETGEHFWDAETHRLRGELLLAMDRDPLEVETEYHQALTIARQQQARSLELRAAMSLCRLWQSRGKIDEAHDLLRPIYDWFSEGFETADLKEARDLLASLA